MCAGLAAFLALVSIVYVVRLNAAPVLVAAYDFNQGSGATLTDASGNNNHGALTNGPVWTTAGKYGGALTFDGTNDLVSINDAPSLDLTTGMTLEAWVRPSTLSGWRTVVLKEIPSSLAYCLYANQSAQRPGTEIRVGSNVYNSSGIAALPANSWTHLAATYDGSIVRLYVNGSLAGSRAVSGSIVTSSSPLRIGGNLVWGEYFRGQIDEVKIYNGALTPSQIQSDMNTPVTPAPGDTVAPSVAMTAPTNGSTVSGTITVSAQGSDNVAVSSVQFLRDGASFGSADSASPYSVNWDTATSTNGTHTLAATAVDAAGNTATSQLVTVTVNNPPRLVISQPANNASISGTTVNVAYSGVGDVSAVARAHFQVDGGPVLVDPTYDGSYQLSNVAAGAHVLTGFLARADGSKIAGSDASPVQFSTTVPDTTWPSVTLTSPAEGAQVGGTVVVRADASDDVGVAGVRFMSDGALIGSEDTTSPYSVNWNTAVVPNGLHTLTAIARDAATHSTTSSAVTVTVSNTTRVALGTLNGRTVYGDGSNKILSWVTPQDSAYDQAIYTAWDFLLNRVPNDVNGLKAYFTNSYLNSGSLTPSGWMHNPAHLNAALIESALAYYAYSGDARVVTLARSMADYHLAHGMTPATWSWARVPYASGCGNCTQYDGTGTNDSAGHIEPDKVGEFGLSLIHLYQSTGDVTYRDAAINAANALANHVRTGNATQSPWPFRVHAQTNVPREDYTPNVIKSIGLFDELIRLNLGAVASYGTARTVALNWLFAYPMQNNVWSNYFEDVDVQSNLSNYNQYIPMETAYYLMRHPEHDPNWRTHVPALLAWVESELGEPHFGAMAINEQVVFRYVMGSHTARYGGVNALYSELTGDSAARDKAYRALNWATYMISTSPQGQIIDGPSVNNVWFTDGYADYVRHFMRGMGAVPEWAPDNQNHLTRSTSIVRAMNYSASEITYTTADPDATDVLKLSFTPVEVAANGVLLPRRTDLDSPGWVYDAGTRVLRVRHAQATSVRISAQATGPDTVAPVISSVGASGVTGSSATVSWATNEPADSQVEYGVTTGYGSSTPLQASYVTSHTVLVSGLAPATVYHYRVRSSDAAGNPAASGDATFTTTVSDTEAPAVSVTAPVGGSTVSGTVIVQATASDDVGVTSVQFLLDGVNLGSPDATAPYSISWSSAATGNGTHVLSARALDAAGHATTSSPVSVTVSNLVQNVITFNDLTNTQAPLNGQYPTGLVDWGSSVWWVSGPWGQFSTNSISFASSRTSGSFTFINPKRLISVRAYNGGSGMSTVTLSCSGSPTKTVSVAANQLLTINTDWTATCSTVTVGSTNGWDTNFDDLIYDGS
jgi:concanavalin A-like lectin/glucanase superfamily protein/Big-like domain-containing protein/purple acid phosphatase-like protein